VRRLARPGAAGLAALIDLEILLEPLLLARVGGALYYMPLIVG
jgi:hypothetical protein